MIMNRASAGDAPRLPNLQASVPRLLPNTAADRRFEFEIELQLRIGPCLFETARAKILHGQIYHSN